MFRCMDLDNVQVDLLDPWDDILANVAWAVRSLYHTTLGATPGELVFGRDMLFNIRNKIDWQLINTRRQNRIDKDRARENTSRKAFDYRVHVNGTLTISRQSVSDRVSVRRVSPYFE